MTYYRWTNLLIDVCIYRIFRAEPVKHIYLESKLQFKSNSGCTYLWTARAHLHYLSICILRLFAFTLAYRPKCTANFSNYPFDSANIINHNEQKILFFILFVDDYQMPSNLIECQNLFVMRNLTGVL